MGVVSVNPCKNVSIPKIPEKEKQIYTPEQAVKFLQLLDKEPMKYRVFFTLAIYSGFRRGELLGLEWKDFDFKNDLVSVKRTSCYTPKKGIYTDTTKTRKSQRTIKLPHTVMALLTEYKAEQSAEAAKLGSKWTDTDRLFTTDTGEPQHPNTTYEWLKRFCKRNGMPFYGIHSYRHFFASVLVNEGVDIVSVSGALGHSVVSTTSNTYCHFLENYRAKVLDAVSNALNLAAKELSDAPTEEPKGA